MELKMTRIGILGAGQLGCMLAESLWRCGAEVVFFEKDPAAPGLKRAMGSHVGDWEDENALRAFFQSCHAVTYEFENVSSAVLPRVSEETGVPLLPGADVLRTTQNRALEKSFLMEMGLPHAAFFVFDTFAALERHMIHNPGEWVLKTATGGYDGKGQWILRSHDDFEKHKPILREAFSKPHMKMVLEELLPLHMEASCIAARDLWGNTNAFDAVENVHAHHILFSSCQPTSLPPEVENEMRQMAVLAAEKMGVVGLLTVEFFLTKRKPIHSQGVDIAGWHLFINEFAPRPHNSGHITRVSAPLSQFDVHAQILLGRPLPPASCFRTLPGGWCMVNLLGEHWPDSNPCGDLPRPNASAGALREWHIYGKTQAKPGRKMGHFTLHSPLGPQEALQAAVELHARTQPMSTLEAPHGKN